VRHLEATQIWGRLHRTLVRPRLVEQPPPDRRQPSGVLATLPRMPQRQTGPTSFRFLNVGRDVNETGWNDTSLEALWRYNLHYFDDLVAEESGARAAWHHALIHRWIDQNPPPHGTGWDAYPTSLRIVNWIKWALSPNDVDSSMAASLAMQARWLSRRVERHLLGNHILANAKALVFAGLFFRGSEADGWRETGVELLRRELPRQILADGAHFELSPMYHAVVLHDLLDLLNVAAIWPSVIQARDLNTWRARVPAMLGWLAAMTHPDGGPAFFNDCAFDVAATPAELHGYATRLGFPATMASVGVRDLAPSGYFCVCHGDFALVADAAPIGPDYLPAHAHADTLSCELSVAGVRFLVNGGTSTYQNDAQRARERGTAAHSTVVVDDQDSSEVWSAFRVGRRARIVGRLVRSSDGGATLSAAHDGYRHLTGRPLHRRTWELTQSQLTVTDDVEGSRDHRTALRWLVHPDVEVQVRGAGRFRLARENVIIELTVVGGASVLHPAEWHPRFGETAATRAIVSVQDGPLAHRYTTTVRRAD
jgi:uncharacterized heparinase superfamily protein